MRGSTALHGALRRSRGTACPALSAARDPLRASRTARLLHGAMQRAVSCSAPVPLCAQMHRARGILGRYKKNLEAFKAATAKGEKAVDDMLAQLPE